MDTILINGLRLTACHGVLPEEHLHPQTFTFDISLETDLSLAGKTDKLVDTVNYAAIVETVSRMVHSGHCNLIEHLADKICQAILEEYRSVQAVSLTLGKPEAPLPQPFDHVAVCIRRHR